MQLPWRVLPPAVYVDMSEKFEDRMLQAIVLESPSGAADLLRSAAHPMRVQILALLLKETRDFSKLMKETRLSKTALANHLQLLMNRRLIQRVDRGEYSLTADGRGLLNAAPPCTETLFKEKSGEPSSCSNVAPKD